MFPQSFQLHNLSSLEPFGDGCPMKGLLFQEDMVGKHKANKLPLLVVGKNGFVGNSQPNAVLKLI